MARSLLETIEGIRSMGIRGAAAIGEAAAKALADHVRTSSGTPAATLASARKAARALDAARPTAVSLHNALGWVLEATAAESTAPAMKAAASEAAARVAREVAMSRQAIAAAGARHLRGAEVVLTHCHSSTVVAVLAAAHQSDAALEVIATETRPFRQGLRTVAALREAGVETALIVDSAVEHVLATRDIDAVVVGADTVARDGSLFNKIGTAGVAALAQMHGVPVYSAAGLHKFSQRPPGDVAIEERAPSEVASPKEVPAGVRIFNPVFDRTEPGRISSYITEEGLASPRKAVALNLPKLPSEEAWG
ncbi:MAG: translation initiation factor eIF-2B [Thermoplasmatota archaeon]